MNDVYQQSRETNRRKRFMKTKLGLERK